ncbi:helix-turn-helix domain-containing protein [Chitinophaga sp. 22321]|uniref:Helix-turn-helix transcriptional regulator n=1 Tax=Chitinophaga hostae TaxID=2831022 RepID=A0ABS5J611_9BACT|nr:helix-turn-helix transcriptional regulator [Chitinophaga hostae]MBS0030501.1 helix-turn-helix transcriptional regulator [Chitinophaga hostae]
MKLNEQIMRARKAKGFTQEELADLAKVTVRTIQRIEYGESVPRSYTLKAIARALELQYEILSVVEATRPTVDVEQPSEEMAHFLQIINLSCFSYLVVPWVHFLVPLFLLKRQKNITGNALASGRKIIRQQIYWTAILQLLLLLTFAYNFIQVTITGNAHYIAHYLGPFIFMYVLNAGLILYNNRLIQAQSKSTDYQSLSYK